PAGGTGPTDRPLAEKRSFVVFVSAGDGSRGPARHAVEELVNLRRGQLTLTDEVLRGAREAGEDLPFPHSGLDLGDGRGFGIVAHGWSGCGDGAARGGPRGFSVDAAEDAGDGALDSLARLF